MRTATASPPTDRLLTNKDTSSPPRLSSEMSHRHRTFALFCDTVDEWLNVLTAVTTGLRDNERLEVLPRQLSSDTLSWFAVDIAPRIETLTWTECRNAIIARFGQIVTDRMVEAADRRLKGKEGVLSYYNDMRLLMNQAGATTDIQVVYLTRGMPREYRVQLAVLSPKTPKEWVRQASALEKPISRPHNRREETAYFSDDKTSKTVKPWKAKCFDKKFDKAKEKSFSKPYIPPRIECQLCGRWGKREKMHLLQACPRSGPKLQVTGHVNAAPASTEPSEQHTSVATILTKNDYIFSDAFINDQSVKPFLDSGLKMTCISEAEAERVSFTPDPETSIPFWHIDGLASKVVSARPVMRIGKISMPFTIHVMIEIDALLITVSI